MTFRWGVVWVGCAVALCLSGRDVKAEDATGAVFDNLFLDVSAGFEAPTGEDTTGYGSMGFNWGIPLQIFTDDFAAGLQAGGDIKLREDNAEYDATFGAFVRDLHLRSDEQAAVALLVDYRRTAQHSDLWSLRPVIGTTLSDADGVGLTGVIGLNSETRTVGATTIRQEAIDRIEAFWNHAWNEKTHTEFSAGYQFSHVDEALFGSQVVYGLTPHLDLAAGGEVNTRGDYSLGVVMSYNFGGTGRHATLHNLGGHGRGLYTPFPKRSFPAMMNRTERSTKPTPLSGGGTITPGNTTDSGNPPDDDTGTDQGEGGDTGGNSGDDTGSDTGGDTGDGDTHVGPGAPGSGAPGSGRPGSGAPGSGRPGSGRPGSGAPGSGRPGSGRPGSGAPGSGAPGSGAPGSGAPGSGQPGVGNPSGGDGLPDDGYEPSGPFGSGE
jgi:hypothetical protein